MGFLQPDVGHRRCDGETRLTPAGKAITVISLAEAEAALAAAEAINVPVTLLSASNAASSVGAGWFDAVVSLAHAAYPKVRVEAALDCGDAPGHAMSALRHGFKIICYCGRNQSEIEDIASRSKAAVLRERPDTLDLCEMEPDEWETACESWLKVGLGKS
ncbi:MAG: hypothetical protein GKS00_12865 [Alphaproteobacteria bacterium]|nr:hypothetical protein [Alphaproteobacteria bacterium]